MEGGASCTKTSICMGPTKMLKMGVWSEKNVLYTKILGLEEKKPQHLKAG